MGSVCFGWYLLFRQMPCPRARGLIDDHISHLFFAVYVINGSTMLEQKHIEAKASRYAHETHHKEERKGYDLANDIQHQGRHVEVVLATKGPSA
jgi:hypothetical protein